jgi:type IV pilus assembly protein PilY1
MKSIAWKTMTRAGTLLAAVFLASTSVHSEDIDIFTLSGTGGSTNQPNVMILVDNSSNWARSSQQWPDNSGKQGQAELQAIYNVLTGIDPLKANIGFAGFTGSGSSTGGYIRFGLRDMTVATNKTAFLNILSHIKADINAAQEKVNDNAEAAAMYEVLKYYKSQSVFRGRYVSGNDPASNVDAGGNAGNPSNGTNRPTASAQGLTSGFALASTSGTTYTGPDLGSCGRHHLVMVINNAQGSVPTGSQTFESTSAGNPVTGGNSSSWTEEWARTLYQSGITVYILDAYNAQQNVNHSRVLALAAAVGGGRYYAVKNQSDIEFALKEILAEINAINSTFATASLPISATNRSQNLNQVFIGMFRPDANAKPRWRGNLKQYQLIRSASAVDLGDALGVNAVNPQTGFIASCAVSLWTTDSSNWWETTYENAGAQSQCTAFPTVGGTTGSTWSDLPDGPSVEKGGVAEVLRKGNNPPTTNTTPTWTSNRTIYTYSSSGTTGMQEITTSNTGWSSTLLDWVKGHDDATATTANSVTTYPYSEFTTTSTSTRTRPSIHGDVIHSRPLPVNYGGTTGVTVYYGANDGMFRAVDASTGKERWAFIAPEHMTEFQRLHDNSPLLPYATVSSTLNPEAKDYFFDGSMGIYQKSDNSKIWIYSTMRRGGRMIYAFDVSNPASPRLKWRVGCPNQSNNDGCTSGFEGLGQTWSVPAVAFLKGWSETTPVVVIGGGYDTCEDANSATPSCSDSRKGRGVYVLNGDTGAILRHLVPTGGTGSVAADLALADANGDGSVDYAYAATTTGEIWRVDFSAVASSFTYAGRDEESWSIRKVAYTSGRSHKFLYPPALFRSGSKMYAAIGSGDREHPLSTQYPYTTPVTNRLYVLLDDLTVTSPTAAAVDLNSTTAMRDFSSETSCDTAGVTPSSSYSGWFMNLTGTGEQTVTSALIAAGMVTFNTNRATPSGVNQCSNPLGEARGYWVNLLNGSGAIGAGSNSCGGTRYTTFVGGGLTPSPTLASVQVGDRVETVVIGAAQRSGGASSGIAPQRVTPTIASKRKTIYWKSNTSE